MVLSSKTEGFGMVIGEALALGVPVISTNCESGPRELLPSENLVPVGDVRGLARLMDCAVKQPEAYYSEFDDKLLPEMVAQEYLKMI